MYVKALEIENILSVGNISLEFGISGLVLLDGWNHDDNSHNGAGKSSIFNALSFALYDTLPRKISASEILRKGTKAGFAKVTVAVGNDEWVICRSRPTKLEVTKNGEICNITQEELENSLGLNYQQFLVCMYSSQVENIKLLSLNDSGKKDFFLRLLRLDDFAEYRKSTDSLIKEENIKLTELKLSYGKVEAKISAYKENLIDKDSLNKEIESLDVSSMEEELDKILELPQPDTSSFDKLESILNNKLKEIAAAEVGSSNAQSSIRRLNIAIADNNSKLEHLEVDSTLITCPHCSESFGSDDCGMPQTREQMASKASEELSSLEKERDRYLDIMELLSDKISSKMEIEENLEKLKLKRQTATISFNENRLLKVRLQSAIRTNKDAISYIEEKISKHGEMVSKVACAEKLLLSLSTKISSTQDQLLVYEAISSALSPTGAPAYVVDSIIDRFNDRVAQYISLIWPNASYELLSYKENKSGDIKAKFSNKLMIGGVERSVGSLSGGENKCLSLAVDFAVIDVVESIFGFTINPIILDEPFEGLDSLNKERVVDILEVLSNNRQIWVIDHTSESKAMFSNIVKVEKQNGISSII